MRIYSAVLHQSHAAHFPLKRLYFSSPKLVRVTPVGDLFACDLTNGKIESIFLSRVEGNVKGNIFLKVVFFG